MTQYILAHLFEGQHWAGCGIVCFVNKIKRKKKKIGLFLKIGLIE